MKTLFSSVLLRLILAIALVQFASLQNARADVVVSPDQLQLTQDASNPLLNQPFPASTVDSPMNSFEAVPIVNKEAKVADTQLHDAAVDQAQHLSIAAIPEPSSWVLLSLGVGTLLAFGYILRQHSRTA